MTGHKGSYLLSIDQGTTGSTVLVCEVTRAKELKVIGRATADFPQHYPKPGWVEHDLDEIWNSVGQAASRAMEQAKEHGFTTSGLLGIGITNQRETICPIERATGRPAGRAIVWQCRRTTDLCTELRRQGHESRIRELTGLVLDPYFSGTKIRWMLEQNSALAGRVARGEVGFGTIDTYVISRLTSGVSFVTEPSNASRTMLCSLQTGQYDRSLTELFGLKTVASLPEIRASAGEFGRTKNCGFLPNGIPITGVLGDQQAALAGQACFRIGEAKCTYGTGAFLLVNCGHSIRHSRSGMLTTIAWSLDGSLTYALEGSAFIAGASVQFLRDQLGLVVKAHEIESMAAEAKGAPEVYFVPALAGLGAPYWDPKARGMLCGLTRGTTKGQIARATLEGIAFQVNDLVTAMAEDLGAPIDVLRVDGGAAANGILMQAQADFSRVPVDRPVNLETTAMGAAMFAGIGAGVFKNPEEAAGTRERDLVFTPVADGSSQQDVAQMLEGWKRAVIASQVFAGTRTAGFGE